MNYFIKTVAPVRGGGRESSWILFSQNSVRRYHQYNNTHNICCFSTWPKQVTQWNELHSITIIMMYRVRFFSCEMNTSFCHIIRGSMTFFSPILVFKMLFFFLLADTKLSVLFFVAVGYLVERKLAMQIFAFNSTNNTSYQHRIHVSYASNVLSYYKSHPKKQNLILPWQFPLCPGSLSTNLIVLARI